MAVFSYSTPAHAGFFSFLGNLFGSSANIQKTITDNSQTMALLEGAINSNVSAGKKGGDIIIVENKALLSSSGPMGTIADIEGQDSNQNQISIYVVREGDNLSQIAKMFKVSVSTIIWANNIKRRNSIKAGQTLVILPISGVRYTVKKGDSLKKIVKKFKGNIKEIVQFNELNEDKPLAVGQTIIIPNGEDTTLRYSPSLSRLRRGLRGAGGPSYIGYYMRPIKGGVKSQGLHGHNAVDLATSCGTPIMASASGNVIIARSGGWNAGYGSYVVVKHPNRTQTLYAHLSKLIVRAGMWVKQGRVIGYVGHTGYTIPRGVRGCHLHFEIRGARNPF